MTVPNGSTKDKVRDLQLNLEDAARLAECFNSFDESDSWPGGFTHGVPFTASAVLEDKTKRSDIRTLVAYVGDRIVGHCNVTQAETDPEAAYVGTLGVSPKYQGQGYGKAMLTEAAETAARMGKRRIDLHTWPGNIKAVPLYKRVGYNWVPGTRVLMESHIPGILNFPMFAEFFKRHYWYDALKREVLQVMDDVVEDGLGVYKYRFAADNGDSLEVTVDREAKGICGFKLNLDGRTTAVSIRPVSHVGYIGFGEVPFHLTVSSESQRDMPVIVRVSAAPELSVRIDGVTKGTVSSRRQFVLGGTYKVQKGVEYIDRARNPVTKVTTQAVWDITLGESTVSLYSGLIPHEAITISLSPSLPCVAPASSSRIGLALRSNLDRMVSGEVVIAAVARTTFPPQTSKFRLGRSERTEVGLQFTTASGDDNGIVSFLISVFAIEGSQRPLVNEKTLNIPVIGAAGALAYEALDNSFVIETEAFRFTMLKTPPMNFVSVENKVLHKSARGFFLLPSVGYPFPSGGSEWNRKRFRVTLRNKATFSEIELEADSIEKPGMKLTTVYRAYPAREYLEVINTLTNVGSTKLTNLGVQAYGWLDMMGTCMYVPLGGNVYKLDSVEWTGERQLPHLPNAYSEPWAAICAPDGELVAGYVWDSDQLVEVNPRRSGRLNRVEYRLPDLDLGESTEKSVLRIVIGTGGWKKVRSLSSRIHGQPEPEMDSHAPRSDLEFEIVPKESSHPAGPNAPMLIDRSRPNDMEIRVRVIHEDPVSAKLSLTMPKGLLADKKENLSFDIDHLSIESPFIAPVIVTATKGGAWLRKDGMALLRFDNRICRVPLSAILYDSGSPATTDSDVVEGNTLHRLSSAGTGISVSAEYCASLVRLGPTAGTSVFQDTFPRADPFLWADRHFTGLNPIIQAWGLWDWQSGLLLEKWSVSEKRKGSWAGYEMKTILEHCPNLKGMEFSVSHMLLKGTSVVRSEIEARNASGESKRVTFGLQGIVRLNGHPQSVIYTVVNSRRLVYEPTVNRAEIVPTAEEGWAAFREPDSGLVLGIMSDCKTDEIISIENVNENAQWLRLVGLRELGPGQTASVGCYFVMTTDVDDVVLMKNLTALE